MIGLIFRWFMKVTSEVSLGGWGGKVGRALSHPYALDRKDQAISIMDPNPDRTLFLAMSSLTASGTRWRIPEINPESEKRAQE
jgi:hypothetical protein